MATNPQKQKSIVAVGAHQKIKDNEGRIMPAMPARLEMCGMRGVGIDVEFEFERAMLAPFLPPALSRRSKSVV